VPGEEKPQIVARLQEFLLEPDTEKTAERVAAGQRADGLAGIGRDGRRVLGEEIDLVEMQILVEEITQRLRIALGILQRLQIVVTVDADADGPILAHVGRRRSEMALFLIAFVARRRYCSLQSVGAGSYALFSVPLGR
jgi:hypothetical protein